MKPQLHGLSADQRRTAIELARSLTDAQAALVAAEAEIVALQALTTPSAWTAATLQNSWVFSGGTQNIPAYRKVGDMVQARFSVKSGTLSAVLWTFPSGFRPPANTTFPIQGNGAAVDGIVEVNASSGEVFIYASQNSLNRGWFQFSVTA